MQQRSDADDPRRLLHTLREALPPHMIPSSIVAVEHLQLGPDGCVDRSGLSTLARVSPSAAARSAEPRTETERRLAEIWRHTLGLDRIDVRESFFDASGNSLLAVKMFAEVLDTFGKKIPLVTLFERPTIEELAEVLDDHSWTPPESTVVPIRPGGSRPPFYCVHGGGGEVLAFVELANAMGEDQPFYGLSVPDMEAHMEDPPTVAEMALRYVADVRAAQPRGPYYIGGFCLGGLVAVEMARELEKTGETVAALVLLDTSIPGQEIRTSQKGVRYRVAKQFYDLKRLDTREKLKLYPRRIKRVLRNMIYRKYAQAGDSSQIPQHLKHKHFMMRFYDTAKQYQPEPYRGNVHLFCSQVYDRTPNLGWDDTFHREEVIHELPGRHRDMIRAPRVTHVAQQIMSVLKNAQTQT